MKLLKNSFRNTIGVSNSLDPDQVRLSVGPDLGPKLFAKVTSADDIMSLLARKELNYILLTMYV